MLAWRLSTLHLEEFYSQRVSWILQFPEQKDKRKSLTGDCTLLALRNCHFLLLVF